MREIKVRKPCVFFQPTQLTNGDWKCRCKRDGSIRNHCSRHCVHFIPTLWWKIRNRKAIREARRHVR